MVAGFAMTPATLPLFGEFKMICFLLLLCVLMLAAGPVYAEQPYEHTGNHRNGRAHAEFMASGPPPSWCRNVEGFSDAEMRGRCGKRRGDWYGFSHPVANAEEARRLLLNYFAGKEFTVSGIKERRWGFKADILNKDGKLVDRVLIDKRSGRIRSLY